MRDDDRVEEALRAFAVALLWLVLLTYGYLGVEHAILWLLFR